MNFSYFSKLKTKNKEGFTLIELLVVIAIIGLISSVVLASLNSARVKAKYAKSQAELLQFIQASIFAQDESGSTLKNITGSGCSACVCRNRDIRNIPTSDACYINWLNALTKIQNATDGVFSNIDQMERDAWGSPYFLDENEREFSPNDCRFDTISSVGPDGFSSTGDDQGYTIPHSDPCP